MYTIKSCLFNHQRFVFPQKFGTTMFQTDQYKNKMEIQTFFVLLACQVSESSDWPQLDMSGRDSLRGIPSSLMPLNPLLSCSDWLESDSPALRRLPSLRLLFFMLFKELFIPSTRMIHSFLWVSASQLRDSFSKMFWRKILNLESPVSNSVK